MEVGGNAGRDDVTVVASRPLIKLHFMELKLFIQSDLQSRYIHTGSGSGFSVLLKDTSTRAGVAGSNATLTMN